MWQLELLSRIVPAFGALARESMDLEQQEDTRRDAQDCYSDLVTVGHALCVSDGERVFSLDDAVVTNLLKALESRLPKAWTTNLLSILTIQEVSLPSLSPCENRH